MHARFTLRARFYLMLAATALLVSALALPLALHARGDRAAAHTLVHEDLVFAASVAEIRVLSLQLQNAAVQAALRRGDGSFAARFAAERNLIAEELRRARLHAPDAGAVDVVDELENSMLRFSAIAERVFAASAVDREAEARVGVMLFDEEGRLLEELSEELATIAGTATETRARGLGGSGRMQALLVLAIAGLVLAAEAFVLAINESGHAIAVALSAITPDRWQQYLPWEDARQAYLPRGTGEEGAGAAADEDEADTLQPVYVLNPEQAAAMAAALTPAEPEPESQPGAGPAADEDALGQTPDARTAA